MYDFLTAAPCCSQGGFRPFLCTLIFDGESMRASLSPKYARHAAACRVFRWPTSIRQCRRRPSTAIDHRLIIDRQRRARYYWFSLSLMPLKCLQPSYTLRTPERLRSNICQVWRLTYQGWPILSYAIRIFSSSLSAYGRRRRHAMLSLLR